MAISSGLAFGIQSVLGDVFKIIGPVIARRAIQIGRPESLHRLKESALVSRAFEIFAAGEHQVLEQMRETRFAGLLILGTDVVPNVHRDDRRLVVFVHEQRQPVFQHELFVRNIDVEIGNGILPAPR